jgi:hypothetical protein
MWRAASLELYGEVGEALCGTQRGRGVGVAHPCCVAAMESGEGAVPDSVRAAADGQESFVEKSFGIECLCVWLRCANNSACLLSMCVGVANGAGLSSAETAELEQSMCVI